MWWVVKEKIANRQYRWVTRFETKEQAYAEAAQSAFETGKEFVVVKSETGRISEAELQAQLLLQNRNR